MGPFTMDVLDQALVQQSRWSMAGYDVCVSVNISAASLRDDELPDKIAGLIAKRSVDPSRITLEITEDSFIPGPTRHCSSWSGCAASASSSPSVFGTAFSSLTYIASSR